MDTIYVAFDHSDRWPKHFLKDGFGHCSILLPMQNGWLQIDPAHGALEFKELTDSQVTHFTKLLRIKLPFHYKFKGIPFKLFTCVTLVEYALGKKIYATTPYRLYKKLTGKLKKHFNTEEIMK